MNGCSFFSENPERYLAARYVIEARERILREVLASREKRRILDLGCGDGSIAFALATGQSRLLLVDYAPGMLAKARERMAREGREQVRLIRADLDLVAPFPEQDLVLCLGVLAHVVHPERLLVTAAESLGRCGTLVVQVTDVSRLLGAMQWVVEAYHAVRERRPRPNPLTARRVRRVLSAAGLVQEAEVRYSLVFPGAGKLPLSLVERLHGGPTRGALSRFIGADWIGVFVQREARVA